MPAGDPEARLEQVLLPMTEGGICLAFSGGCDSALLLAALVRLKRRTDFPLLAIHFAGPFQTEDETSEAKAQAGKLGVELKILHPAVLEIEQVRRNDRRRCYYCKRMMFGVLAECARTAGLRTVADGTNADDLSGYRPGRQALQELGVRSPLAEAGLVKSEVRRLAAELGVASVNRPAAACLATRFPYDTVLTAELLHRAEAAERCLREAGFENFRVRCHDSLARIEVSGDEAMRKLLDIRETVTERLRALGFRQITLDLAGFRSGSFDE